MVESSPKKVESTAGNCSLRALSPFPTVFFKGLVMQTRKNQGLFGKELTYSHTMTPFDAPGKQAF